MATNSITPKPELLPCPFCGEDAAEYEFSYSHKRDHHRRVFCQRCGLSTAYRETYRIAAKNWNRRA